MTEDGDGGSHRFRRASLPCTLAKSLADATILANARKGCQTHRRHAMQRSSRSRTASAKNACDLARPTQSEQKGRADERGAHVKEAENARAKRRRRVRSRQEGRREASRRAIGRKRESLLRPYCGTDRSAIYILTPSTSPVPNRPRPSPERPRIGHTSSRYASCAS